MVSPTPAIAALAAACLVLAAPGASYGQVPEPRTRSITIAILDTGVAPLPLALNLGRGYDFVDDNATSSDRNGHGTAMASVAAMCSRCTIIPVRIAGAAGIGTATTAVAGLRWSIAHRIRVVNFSLTSCAPDPELTLAIADATSHGVVVVLAAGNGARPIRRATAIPLLRAPRRSQSREPIQAAISTPGRITAAGCRSPHRASQRR